VPSLLNTNNSVFIYHIHIHATPLAGAASSSWRMSLGSGGPSPQDTAEGVDVVVVREVGAA
jgi:hypothetical protein